MAKASLAPQILETIKQLASEGREFGVADILERLPRQASRQYVTRLLRQLVEERVLLRSGATRSVTYRSTDLRVEAPIFQGNFSLRGLKDYIALEHIYQTTPALLTIKEDIRSIFSYAFTEMMNNAIDHSKSEQAEVRVTLTELALHFIIRDFGIGVFKNVQVKYGLKNEFEAMEELLKGKTTTAPQAHSGEGIFFTSKVADVFSLRSFEYELLIDNRLPDIFAGQLSTSLKGTEVGFEIALTSTKHLNDVFREYTNPTDLSFDKTHAYVKLYTTGTIYVSRSQAKRILAGLDTRNFREVVLDFHQVPNIGQAFADEIFRVFATQHPDIKLTPLHMNEAVSFMVGRVAAPPQQKPLF